MSSPQQSSNAPREPATSPRGMKRRASSATTLAHIPNHLADASNQTQQTETSEPAAEALARFQTAQARLNALAQANKATHRSNNGGESATDLDKINPEIAEELGIGFISTPPKKTRDELAEVEAELRAKGLLEKRVDVDLTADTSEEGSPAVAHNGKVGCQRGEGEDGQPGPKTAIPQPLTGSIRTPAPLPPGSLGPEQSTPQIKQASPECGSKMLTLTASWSPNAPATTQAPPTPPAPAPVEAPALSVLPASIINRNANPEYGPSSAASAAHGSLLPKHGRNIPIRGMKLNPIDAEDRLEQFWALYPSLRFVLRQCKPLRPYLLRFGPTYDEQIAALSRESGIQAIMIPQVPAKGWWNWMEDWDTAYSSSGVEQMRLRGGSRGGCSSGGGISWNRGRCCTEG